MRLERHLETHATGKARPSELGLVSRHFRGVPISPCLEHPQPHKKPEGEQKHQCFSCKLLRLFKTAVTFESTADIAPLALNLEGKTIQNILKFRVFTTEKRTSMRTGMQTREERRFFSPTHIFFSICASAAVPIGIPAFTIIILAWEKSGICSRVQKLYNVICKAVLCQISQDYLKSDIHDAFSFTIQAVYTHCFTNTQRAPKQSLENATAQCRRYRCFSLSSMRNTRAEVAPHWQTRGKGAVLRLFLSIYTPPVFYCGFGEKKHTRKINQ